MAYYRYPWASLPSVLIHQEEMQVRSHIDYDPAKSGDSDAAYRLVKKNLNFDCVRQIKEQWGGANPILISAHAFERSGVNAIPETLAEILSEELGLEVDPHVVQTNIVSHTKADGFSRLARQAEFEGKIERKRNYILVDDFVGQGGTLANLRGWVMHEGGIVIGATVLTGKSYSATLSIETIKIDELRKKHSEELENWWISCFGFGYECLTSSEGRYLINTPTAQKIRDRIIAASEG